MPGTDRCISISIADDTEMAIIQIISFKLPIKTERAANGRPLCFYIFLND
ncbi:MAG: hypothetical protein WCH09_00175 [Bacteroidota bacterium]